MCQGADLAEESKSKWNPLPAQRPCLVAPSRARVPVAAPHPSQHPCLSERAQAQSVAPRTTILRFAAQGLAAVAGVFVRIEVASERRREAGLFAFRGYLETRGACAGQTFAD